MPSAPTDLTVTKVSCTRNDLAWVAPADGLGADLIGGGSYDGGPKTILVIPGRSYRYVHGANEDGLTNAEYRDGPSNPPTLVEYGSTTTFVAGAVSVEVDGTGAVTATLHELTFQSYRIYRDDVLLREVLPHPPDAKDLGLTSAPHTYSVSSVDAAGGESPRVTWNTTDAWQKTFGGVGSDILSAVTVGPDDSVIIMGTIQGTVDFGTGPVTAVNQLALVVVKFSAVGVCQWTTVAQTTVGPVPSSVCTDSAGNIYATGWYYGSITFGSTTLTALQNSDAFLVKLNSSGVVQWATSYGIIAGNGIDSGGDTSYAVACDAADNVIIAGKFQQVISFDNNQTFLGSHWSGSHQFIAKFNSSGTHLWSKAYAGITGNGNLATWIFGIATDASNNIYASGLVNNILYISKYASNGDLTWHRSFGVLGQQGGSEGTSVAVAPDGNIIVFGNFFWQGYEIEVGGDFLPRTTSVGTVFLAKYSSANGDHIWSTAYPGQIGYQRADAVKVDTDGNIVILGRHQQGPNFGGGQLPGAGNENVFIAKFDSNRTHIWSEAIVGTGSDGSGLQDTPTGLALDSDGNVIVCGFFNSPTLPLGWQEFTLSSGLFDAFLYKRSGCP